MPFPVEIPRKKHRLSHMKTEEVRQHFPSYETLGFYFLKYNKRRQTVLGILKKKPFLPTAVYMKKNQYSYILSVIPRPYF